MDRTYNGFVDNGLFVLANYLDKEIENINLDDIKNQNNLIYFSKLFEKLYKTEKYRAVAFSSFQNSAYTQSSKKKKNEEEDDEKSMIKSEDIYKQYDKILSQLIEENKGDMCSICGKYTVPEYDKVFLSSLTKSMFPRLASNTFFNFSNNLKKQNVCPTCLFLSMLSFFNIKSVLGQCVLFNSDDNEYLYDYTYEHNIELNKDIVLNAEKYKSDKKDSKTYRGEISELIEDKINNNKIYDGYIEIIKFYNSSRGESYQIDILNREDVIFVKDLMSKSLLSEFKEKGLFKCLLVGTLQKNYLSCVFQNEQIKISKPLFDKIEERYSKLSKEKLELIKKVTNQVYEKISKDISKELKGIDKLNQFEKMMIGWIENIPNLMTIEEFNSLCNIKEFSSIKNRMYVELINLKNEGER